MSGRNTPVIVQPGEISTMARHIGWTFAALLAFGSLALSADATPQAEHAPKQAERAEGRQDKRGDSHERRPWWKNPRDMAEIGLTTAQSEQIDKIFRTEIEKMRPMRQLITELERGVDATSRANTTDIEAYARQVKQVEHKRAELNTARTVMLYRMRRVLNAEQNVKLQAFYDRREAERRKLDADRRR
jgi:Spy/CpxP family protein refolding chaperone